MRGHKQVKGMIILSRPFSDKAGMEDEDLGI